MDKKSQKSNKSFNNKSTATKSRDVKGNTSHMRNSKGNTTNKPDRKGTVPKGIYSKGVETMYRNAYRAQLDLISLAATKANIMISLNSFLVSVILVTGSVFFENVPGYIIPIVIFIITSVISIYFALSSASPDRPDRRRKFFSSLFMLLTGKVSFNNFDQFRKLPQKNLDRKGSNILVFEDYAKVPRKMYLEFMEELIHDQDKLYLKMSEQLYTLGKMADKKFTLLRYSYTVFRWGLILAITVFLGIRSFDYVYPDTSMAASDLVSNTEYMRFDKVYEPSGVQVLPDGRLIVIEDEASSALQVLEIQSDKTFKKNVRLSNTLMHAFPKLKDLESIAMGSDGYIYAMTSHQRNSAGVRSKKRELFIRFKIEGDRIIDAGIYRDLVQDIEKSGILGKEVDDQGNSGIKRINIESLSFDQENRLMIGFRAPLKGEKNIFGILNNPSEVFQHNKKPDISDKPLLLNLHGGGIRAMTYDETLGGYLISNEIKGIKKGSGKYSQLLFWDGNPSHRIHHMKNSGIKNVEGIAAVQIGKETRVLMVSDDGKRSKNRPASYTLLKYQGISNN